VSYIIEAGHIVVGPRTTDWTGQNANEPRVRPRGAVKKKMTKVTYICRSAKKKVVTYFILFLFLFLFFIDFF
jgi:hypothetical protein